jgi:hypothetical protein
MFNNAIISVAIVVGAALIAGAILQRPTGGQWSLVPINQGAVWKIEGATGHLYYCFRGEESLDCRREDARQ